MFITLVMSSLLLTNAEASLLQSLLPYASDRETERIHGLLTGRVKETPLDRYCPHKPWPKQRAFLGLDCREAFYGGAAGPGKTDALLMAALEYVDVPNYAALILRKSYQRLSKPGAIMDRAQQWLANKARWNGTEHSFRFPSGAVLQFGYIDNPADRYEYQSAEFQFIAFDELTEFRLNDDESNPYLFMFSRLRRTEDLVQASVPLRIRSASNPGGEGHTWVKNRFITDEALAALRDAQPRVFYADANDRDRAFIPGMIADNPSLPEAEYCKTLEHLPPVTRERLMRGDWSILEDALIRVEWLRDYAMRGEIVNLLRKDGSILATFDVRECLHFATADTAGTSEDKAKDKKGKPPSWSVIAVWCRPPFALGNMLLLRDVWRKRVEYTDLLAGFRHVQKKWRLPRILVEDKHFGPAIWSQLRNEMPIEMVQAGIKGKVERNAPLLNMLEQGRVYLPKFDNEWRPALESEWLSWTGLDDETADQIDVGGYAAREVMQVGGAWGGVIQN
jgi:phage terminase large subunit-like protein